ncbi:PAS domain S-box protein, partial [bacterium]
MSKQKDTETKPAKQKSNLTHRSKMILETSMDGFCMTDLDGKLLDVNSSLCDITGYSKKELLAMKITDIEALETPEQTAQRIDKVVKQGHDRFETKHRHRDGKIINIEVSSQVCDLDENKFFFSFFRDITQRKKSEEELRGLICAINNCGEGLAIADTQGVLQYTNNAFARMHGYKPDELLGKHLSIFHLPEQIPVVEAANRQLVSTGSFVGEIWHSRRDGTVFLTRMNNVLLIDKAGNTIGMIGTLQDITKLKKIEKAIEESEERYKTLFQKAAEGILVADIETKEFKYANPAICRMLGYTEKEMKTMSVRNIHPEENWEYVFPEFEAQVRGEKTLSPSLPCLRKDGAIIYANINSAKI